MGPPVIFVPHLDGATAYFGVRFQRGQRLFWSTPVWGHKLYLVFTGLFHSENTGPWQILSTGQKIISVGDFNWGTDNFCQADTGPYACWDVEFNRATVNLSTGHRSFPDPVFP